MPISQNIKIVQSKIGEATLVAVSKTKSVEEIMEAYQVGQRDFGENYVQELLSKHEQLPKDIRWHMIGHLQSNKVKYIAPFVHLIHGVDSFKLLKEINKEAKKNNRILNCLLQVHIAQEETKFGFDKNEIITLVKSEELKSLEFIRVCGLMSMGSNTDDLQQVEKEFKTVADLFNQIKEMSTYNCHPQILSLGMSHDFELAIRCGSNMVRVGSLIFGNRSYSNQ